MAEEPRTYDRVSKGNLRSLCLMIFIGMRDYRFTPCSSHLPVSSGGKPHPAAKIGTGIERLDS